MSQVLAVQARPTLPRTLRHLAAATLLCCAGLAHASTISLFNTGVDAGGALADRGTVDAHWRIVAGPGITSPQNAYILNDQSVGNAYYQLPSSQWIANSASGTDASVYQLYIYELSFDLTGYDPTTATLSGLWGVDNVGNVLLNGVGATGTGDLMLRSVDHHNFQNAHAFTITSGFIAGVNRLQFEIGDTGGVTGLNVSDLSLSATPNAVPEPGSLSLLALGVLGLWLRRRRDDAKG